MDLRQKIKSSISRTSRTPRKRPSSSSGGGSFSGAPGIPPELVFTFESRRKRRFLFLCTVMLLGCVAVLVRAAYLQVIPNPRLKTLAEKQFQKMIHLTPRRGAIVDKEGRTLAVSIEKFSVYAMKNDVLETRKTARMLSPILHLPERTLIGKLQSKGNFQWLVRRIDRAPAEKIERLRLPGIGVVREYKRFYPQNSLAAHILGFVGSEGQGLEGVELQQESLLKGEPEKIITLRDALGRPIFLKNDANAEAREGYRITLTIDSTLQYLSEKYLKETIQEFHATEGSVIMMDPKSGAIRAMASYPTYNLNEISKSPSEHRRNRAITDFYEPGSTFKAMTLAIALDHKIVDPNEQISTEKGKFKIGGYTINEAHEDRIPTQMTPRELLMKSNNVASAKVALSIGADLFFSSLLKFGFGTKTGIDLPGEVVGMMKPLKEWRGVNLATVGFGQGISVTPLQLARSYGAFASQGHLVTPYVVTKVETPEGQVVYDKALQTQPHPQVVSEPTAKLLSTWLEDVVSPNGTAPNVAITGVRIAGKTGTAQRVDHAHGGYLKGSYVASFVGYAPAEKADFVLIATIHNPKPVYYGNLVAGPLWKKIAMAALQTPKPLAVEAQLQSPQKTIEQPKERTLRNTATATSQDPLSIPDDTPSKGKESNMPSVVGLSLREALNQLKEFRDQTRFTGSGRVVSQFPPAQSQIGSHTTIQLQLDDLND